MVVDQAGSGLPRPHKPGSLQHLYSDSTDSIDGDTTDTSDDEGLDGNEP
jgi:hypothetical protein